MADGKVVIETDLDSSGIQDGLSRLGSITEKGLKVATVAIAGTAAALGGMALAAIKVGADFESQMSRVKAISGATGEEFEKLKQQAIELGADTTFSSKEAAEGMENLAAAGFTTNEIMDAMPGLLDLAAASGEDLSTSSEIAASTLRGFGLEAKDAAHVADVLAANANKTNSSVAQTGEAMKFVSPIARSMGLSLEETAAAIGIMANAGIQGSQAGTTLRGALSRLSKPTDVMQQAMDELGVSFYDSEGKMKSLTEQVAMMRKATEGMTDEQKNNYLVTLYGQEALSGMLALINEGEGSLNELTDAYKNSDGEAKKAAETMRDNLSGAIEELGGSAESLGIVFYESVSESLKDAAKSATDSINNITDAFNNGGLDEAIETAGDEFANLAVDVASHAPEMVDAAVDFIESFARGIGNNKDKLLKAAGDTAKALASGLSDLLPDELQAPIDKAIDAISKSLSSGGLKQAGLTAAGTFENLVDAAEKLAKVALPPLIKALDFAGDNLDVLAVSSAAAFTAIKGYTIATKASKAVGSLSATVGILTTAEKANALQVLAASGALTAKEMIVGVLTGKVKLATAAQAAWNAVMNVNPIGLMVVAVSAWVGAMAAVHSIVNRTTEAEKEHSQALEKSSQEAEKNAQVAQERRQSYEEFAQSQDKQAAGDIAQLDRLQSLNSELSSIVDENGKVKAGEEDRAAFITSQLSEALGIEISMTDNQIDNYQELKGKIQELIQQKRIDAVLTAQQAKYEEAVANQLSVAADASANYTAMKKAENDASAEQAELSDLEAKKKQAVTDGNKALVGSLSEKIKKQKEDVDAAQDALEKSRAAYQENTELLKQYSNDIDMYTAVAKAAASGNAEAIEAAIAQITAGIKTASNATSEELQKQVIEVSNTENLIRQEVEKGTPGFTEAMLNQAQSATQAALEEFAKTAPQTAEELAKVPPEAVAALIAGDMNGKLSAEAAGAVQGMLQQFDGLDAETQEKFAYAVYGALKGLEGFDQLKDPAKDGVEAFLETLRGALDEHSPSRKTEEIFRLAMEGAANGLDNGKEGVLTKASEFITAFLEKFTDGGNEEKLYGIGSKLMSLFGLGLGSQEENINNTSKGIADSSNKNLGSANTKGTGAKKSSEYNAGVGSNKGNIDKTSTDIANSSNNKLGAANTGGTGNRKGTEYGNGLGGTSGAISRTAIGLSDTANTGMGSADTGGTGTQKSNEYNSGLGSADTYNTGRTKAQEGKDGLGSVDASGTGSNFIQGFINGIGLGDVWSAAWDMGKKALSALKEAIKEGSPSRLTRLSGRFFGKGFKLGINDEEKAVEKSAENMGQVALDALDMSAVTSRMREAMAFNTTRVAKSFNLETSQNIIHRQESKENLHLADEDILLLAKQFGTVAGNVFADNMDGMKIQAYERELFRMIREGNKS